jgi:hypothetical protein
MRRTTTASTRGERNSASTCERPSRPSLLPGWRRLRPVNPGLDWSDSPGLDSDFAGAVSVWTAGWIGACTRTDLLRPLAYAERF